MSMISSGLDQRDLDILAFYAKSQNRELYFNYLAQREGSDGYALLALGVVRNDNVPGATANCFADRQARANRIRMGESDWQAFGVDLMRADFALREGHFRGNRPDLALNLPVEDVQASHDPTFGSRGIDPSGWTPYKLITAAREYGGREEAEAVWKMLLDNRNLGLNRGAETTALVARYREHIDNPQGYLADLAAARLPHGVEPVNNLDPDRVLLHGQMHVHDGSRWQQEVKMPVKAPLGPIPAAVPVGSVPAGARPVSDPQRLRDLEDARATRQLREELRQQFHPDDPCRHRPIMKSPEVLSDAAPLPMDAGRQMAGQFDPTSAQHPRNGLYRQCAAGVQGLDAQVAKPWDRHSECMAASLTALAAGKGLERVDHVLLSGPAPGLQPGQNVFVVQGEPSNPAHLRAHMPTAQAVATPPEQSFRQLAVSDQQQAQEQALQRSQEQQPQQAHSAVALHA